MPTIEFILAKNSCFWHFLIKQTISDGDYSTFLLVKVSTKFHN